MFKDTRNNINDVVRMYVYIFNFEYISHLFSSVSIVDFEQVKANWVSYSNVEFLVLNVSVPTSENALFYVSSIKSSFLFFPPKKFHYQFYSFCNYFAQFGNFASFVFFIDLIGSSKIKWWRLYIPNVFGFYLFVFNIFDVQTNNVFRNVSAA